MMQVRYTSTLRPQRGISLLFSLLALVLLSFGALALLRTVDTGTMIMGNMAFKQDALSASSAGTEQAIAWLEANQSSPSINGDLEGDGYYASARDQLDVSGNKTSAANKRPVINWTGDCQGLSSSQYELCDLDPKTGTDVNGNKIQWVITRLCDTPGIPTGSNRCLRPAPSAAAAGARERGELKPGGRIVSALTSPYYRVIVRAQGPRNTVVYTETLLHF